jgi:hypothetical protein
MAAELLLRAAMLKLTNLIAALTSSIALFACTSHGAAGYGDEQDITASAAARKPSDPVATAETIRVKLPRFGGDLERVYVPVFVGGRTEHVMLDSGTARTWFRLANTPQEFTPNAFVGKIGDSTLSVFGRNVPDSNELVDGRQEIGCIGTDWLSAGPVVLDLRNSTLVRHPPGFVEPGSESWPVVRIQQTWASSMGTSPSTVSTTT